MHLSRCVFVSFLSIDLSPNEISENLPSLTYHENEVHFIKKLHETRDFPSHLKIETL